MENGSNLPVPLKCAECDRANTPSARRCLWCGAPIIIEGVPPIFEPTQAELDYIGGIERLHDPAAVRVAISETGIEITETMPGSRKIVIDAAAVLDAKVSDGANMPNEGLDQPWWSRLGRSLFHNSRRAESPETRDYTLTIRYLENDEVCSAIFKRQGSTGLLMIQLLARAVGSMVRRGRRI